jgi:hypothetical protein
MPLIFTMRANCPHHTMLAADHPNYLAGLVASVISRHDWRIFVRLVNE